MIRFLLIPLLFLLGSGFASGQSSCPEKVKIRVLIKPDNFPGQVTWSLTTSSGDTLKKGNFLSDSLCVDSNACVKFTIRDSGGNGLCCNSGTGYYKVYYGNQLARSNYKFGSSESFFMGCSSCTPGPNQEKIRIYVNPDKYPTEISWDLINAGGDTLAKGKTFGDTVCVATNQCLKFTMRDQFGDGICCNNGEGSYQLFFGNNLVAQGGAYTQKEESQFNCPPGSACGSPVIASLDTFVTSYDDHWYKFTPDTTGQFMISTCSLGNACSTAIWVYDYCNGLVPSEGMAGTIAYSSDGCGAQAELKVILNKNQAYYIRIGDDANNCNSDQIRWRLAFLGPVVGCMDPLSCTYNPIATVNDPALCLYNPDTACPDQPDLVVQSDLLYTSFQYDSLQNNDACYIQEGCLKGFGQRYLIKFSTRIENIGSADYYIGKPPANPNIPSTQWIWDPCHGHWHYKGYAEYVLYDRNSNPIPAGFKAGFCVMDLNCSIGGGIPKYNCSNQGITAGCGDIYSSGLKCQWVDITDVDTGSYTLVARVNWDNSPDLLGRIESNMFNNWGQVCFKITKNSQGRRFVTRLNTCNPYVDCDGQVFGPAKRDCQGVCHGTALQGDITGDTVRDNEDLAAYETGVRNGSIASSPCKDLNGDSKVDVVDYHMLKKCLNQTGNCNFPPLVQNPNQVVRLSIDSVHLAEGYADLAITNPLQDVVAFQFQMSGLSIDSLKMLGVGDSGTISLFHNSQGMIAGSLIGNRIQRHVTPGAFLRVYFDTTTGTQACINTISSILGAELQMMGKQAGPCKSLEVTTYVSQRVGRSGVRLIPNPFQHSTRLIFSNPANTEHSLILYDSQGRIVRKTFGITGSEVRISGQGLSPGMYRFQLIGNEIRTGNLILE